MWLFLAGCTFVTDAEWAARTPACSTDGLFLDLDGDGYGRQAARTCEEAADAIPTNGDCDDGNPAINPAAAEVWYDGIDEDCDDLDDYDADKDGYTSALHSDGPDCMDQPTDPVPTKLGGDCEDPSGAPSPEQVHPGAGDVAYDGVDMDCSGGTDFDGDHDGYATCDGDCDDAVSTVNPGVPEVWYDGIDQDCDGNDGDKDEDGYVAEGYTGGLPVGALSGDCDDAEDTTHPGATDLFYDGVDADCAGNDDYDKDDDGEEDPRGGGDDCDDEDPTISPLETEDCATAWDDDCDGATDALNAVGCSAWYLDADGDGLGSAASVCTCASSGDYRAASATDCDDGDAAVTIPVWYLDADGDGAGVPDTTAAACAVPAGYAATDDDCDDAERATYPGATEACDTVDSDCDGELNDADALTGCTEFYADDDGDAYAGARSECLCVAEGDYLFAAEDDCDDADAGVNPGAAEVCNDGADDDCDGAPGACSFGGAVTTADAWGAWYGTAAGDEAGGVLLAGGISMATASTSCSPRCPATRAPRRTAWWPSSAPPTTWGRPSTASRSRSARAPRTSTSAPRLARPATSTATVTAMCCSARRPWWAAATGSCVGSRRSARATSRPRRQTSWWKARMLVTRCAPRAAARMATATAWSTCWSGTRTARVGTFEGFPRTSRVPGR